MTPILLGIPVVLYGKSDVSCKTWFAKLSESSFWSIRKIVAENPNTPYKNLRVLLNDKNIFVKILAKKTIELKDLAKKKKQY